MVELRPANKELANFSLAYDGQRYIYVSGGWAEKLFGLRRSKDQDSVLKYDTVNDAWSSIQSLSQSRHSHSSLVLAQKLYVFGGFAGRGDVWQDSLEVLDLQVQNSAWKLIQHDDQFNTFECSIGSISDHEIIIIGGGQR